MTVTRLTVKPISEIHRQLGSQDHLIEMAAAQYWATYGFKIDSEEGEIVRLGRAVHAAMLKWRASPNYNPKSIHMLVELEQSDD